MKRWMTVLIVTIIAFSTMTFAATHDPWDGTKWDVASPDIDQVIGNHYKEMYDLRKGVAIRVNKEHVNLATSSVGGEHIPGGSAILFYDDTTAVDANVSASTFIHDALIYDTTLLQFFTMNEAGDTKVAITIGTAGIADANVMTADIADANVTSAKIADANVLTADIADLNVTEGKLANNAVAFGKLGCEIDEDNMASDSAVHVPTQQSVKAYVDTSIPGAWTPSSYTGEESITFPNGLVMKHGSANSTLDSAQQYNFGTAFGTACISVTVTRSTADASHILPVSTINAAYFKIDRNAAIEGTNGFYWQALGY